VFEGGNAEGDETEGRLGRGRDYGVRASAVRFEELCPHDEGADGAEVVCVVDNRPCYDFETWGLSRLVR
jgi:hypothetical protein